MESRCLRDSFTSLLQLWSYQSEGSMTQPGKGLGLKCLKGHRSCQVDITDTDCLPS